MKWDWDVSLKSAIRIGIRPAEYNEMTPHELNLCIHAFNEDQKIQSEDKLTIAYMNAYWHRVEKLPSLKQVLGQEPVKKKMTDKEMFNWVKALNAMLGGTIQKGGE
ncbi:hypothetical protein [Mesobacillus subterraneus]|uniref:Uncharacterized protein n=1 Tax=Mesobacillus subterraneus TaxID=285983 RepID=A0A427TE57_9BACI|nr:hypothetical protein [Mesobacillus subterraneus]RSD21078.1 hypothetical protein EJA10_22535 [Mesobacillus subterraneus]